MRQLKKFLMLNRKVIFKLLLFLDVIMILFCFLQSYLLAIYICVFTDRITWFLQFVLNIKFLIYHNDILVMLKYDFLFKIQLTYLQEKTYNSKICFKTIRMWGENIKRGNMDEKKIAKYWSLLKLGIELIILLTLFLCMYKSFTIKECRNTK